MVKDFDGVVCDDNLNVLTAIKSDSIDLIYLDPPFSTGVRRKTKTEQYDDTDKPQTRLDFLKPRILECQRVLSPNGSIFLHLDWRLAHPAKLMLDDIFGRSNFINEIIWCYSLGGRGDRCFAKKHDTILWYGKTEEYAFFPDAVRVPRKVSHMKLETTSEGTFQVKKDRVSGKSYRYLVSKGKIPEAYWVDIETLNRKDRQRTGWPTQKPEKLLERLIKATTLPGDMVADFFGGSGTTASVASKLQRRYLSVDISERACEICRVRLGIL